MRDNLEEYYTEFKKTFEVLPTNNKANRQKKLDYLLDEEKNTNSKIKIVLDEIKFRLSPFDSLCENEDIKKVSDKLATCNVTNEWNPYNTSYEKMHLDFYLYQLERYSKEDLVSVNDCLKKIVASFEKVGVVLTKEDFNFNNYAADYMELILNKSHEEGLKNLFEDIYWRFPELIKTIGANFKSIYLRYEKKIDKYYKLRNEEFLKTYNEQDIFDMRLKLNKQLKNLRHRDGYLIFNKFKDGEYFISTFNEASIEKIKSTYFNETSYNPDNLTKLSYTLFEYSLMVKYAYLLNDMKERLSKKDEFKSSKANALKAINDSEKKVLKLNKANNHKGLFGKKNDEKWLFKYNEALNDIISKYDSFDNECFNDLVYSKLSQDSSVLEVLKLVTSCYLYFATETKKQDENRTISDITKDFNELKEDVNNKQYTLLNNIVLLEDRDMKQIISDKYKLEGINISADALDGANVEKTIGDIKTLIRYEDIQGSQVDLDDIELYLEYQKLTEKN